MRKYIAVLITFLLFCCASVIGKADNADNYEEKSTIKYLNGEYVLYNGEEETKRDGDLSKLLSATEQRRVYLDNLRIYETVELTDADLEFSGKTFCDGNADIIIGENARIVFSNLELSMLTPDSSVIVNGGELILDSAVIDTSGECPLYIENAEGSYIQIINDTEISSAAFDITSSEIVAFMNGNAERYTGKDVFSLCYTGKAQSLADIAYYDTDHLPPVTLYAPDGAEIPIYCISYVSDFGTSFNEYRLQNEVFALPLADNVAGYDFLGWNYDEKAVSETVVALSPMTLYAEYVLADPDFRVTGLEFVYDGEYRTLSPTMIAHPLLFDGDITYRWYRDGQLISKDEQIKVKNVSDSGSYALEIEFRYKDDSSVAYNDEILVNIAPRVLSLKYDDGGFNIVSGEIADGDEVIVTEVEKDGAVYAETDNSNYFLDYIPKVTSGDEVTLKILGWTLLLLFLLLVAAYFIFRSAETDSDILTVKRNKKGNYSDDMFVRAREDEGEIREAFFTVNGTKADELLSDKLARNMILKGGTVITEGNGKTTLSLGEINDRFSAGASVDINVLKEYGAIPRGASVLKITSEGILDKPIKIFANEFDITAVKMIVLAGGEAIRVKSQKKEMNFD